MGSIGEHAAVDAMAERGWTNIGALSRGRNGVDLVMQKTIRGKVRTLIVESKVNSSRMSRLQKAFIVHFIYTPRMYDHVDQKTHRWFSLFQLALKKFYF